VAHNHHIIMIVMVTIDAWATVGNYESIGPLFSQLIMTLPLSLLRLVCLGSLLTKRCGAPPTMDGAELPNGQRTPSSCYRYLFSIYGEAQAQADLLGVILPIFVSPMQGPCWSHDDPLGSSHWGGRSRCLRPLGALPCHSRPMLVPTRRQE
jgi:hypothetical protein